MALPRASLLAHASERMIQTLEGLARPVQLSAGAALFEEGDTGDTLYAVCYGALEISVLSPDGRKLVLDVVTAGNLIGEIALFDPGVRTASASARSACTLLSISRPHLLGAIQDNPELGLDITTLIARRLRHLTEQIQDQVFLRLPERLARKILYLTADGDPPSELLTYSHGELAEFVGTSRETVTKTLAQWSQAGVVDIKRQQIRILDRAELRFIAGIDLS